MLPCATLSLLPLLITAARPRLPHPPTDDATTPAYRPCFLFVILYLSIVIVYHFLPFASHFDALPYAMMIRYGCRC